MGKILDWLAKPAGAPPVVEHSSLASLVVSTQAQQIWRQQNKALAVASIFRARMMNADTLASLPVKVGDSLVPAPNDSQDTYGFVHEAVLSLEDTGDAYIRKFTNGDLRVLDPSRMEVQWNKDETQRVYKWDGRRMRAWGIDPPLYVLSLNRGVKDLTGYGPMQSGRIRGLIAEQAYSQEFFENQAQATGNLKHPGVLTNEEAKALVEVWEAGQAERGTGVLSGGLEYERSGFSPTDSEWTETHLVGIGDVATLFGIPSYLLNYSQPGSTLTYSNVGDIYQAYWRMTLKPTYARRIEAMYSSATGQQVRFDPEELFLASMQQRVASATQLTMYGYEPAEVLDVLGIPPISHTGKVPVTLLPEEEDSLDNSGI